MHWYTVLFDIWTNKKHNELIRSDNNDLSCFKDMLKWKSKFHISFPEMPLYTSFIKPLAALVYLGFHKGTTDISPIPSLPSPLLAPKPSTVPLPYPSLLPYFFPCPSTTSFPSLFPNPPSKLLPVAKPHLCIPSSLTLPHDQASSLPHPPHPSLKLTKRFGEHCKLPQWDAEVQPPAIIVDSGKVDAYTRVW